MSQLMAPLHLNGNNRRVEKEERGRKSLFPEAHSKFLRQNTLLIYMPGSPVPSNLLCHPGVHIICRLLRLQGFTKLVNLQFWLEAQIKNLLPSNLPFPIHGESLFLIPKGTLLALNKTLKV